jgi:hypothetical protein
MSDFEIKNLMPKRYWYTKPDGTRGWKHIHIYKRPSHSHEVCLGSVRIDNVSGTGDGHARRAVETAKLAIFQRYFEQLVSYCDQHEIEIDARYGWTWDGRGKVWFYAKQCRRRLVKLITLFAQQIQDRLFLVSNTSSDGLQCWYSDWSADIYNSYFAYQLNTPSPYWGVAEKVAAIATKPWCKTDTKLLFSSQEDRMMAAMLLA